ncbi:hypothetical protein [Mycolicibacterium sediminis]|uniref:PASTA domain-containing protein n=1 Tax=Mycolicibacterium sediminis TaxID=1286180 RepID=A0A7I7QUL1_9MYCO|nr:hypothetical protein [Mycolicibacterium sediminis]BBY30059.1 hypothetical protein MSEDJ_41550 [Mycolicibacterium sediminis]
MKKLAVMGAGAIAAATVALISPGVADSQPASAASLNVVGEPFGKAVAILRSQGVKAFFGGSVGSDYPQQECIVSQQKITKNNRVLLNVDCTETAVLNATDNTPAGAGGGGGPRVGGNGVTTVTATPVGPQPGMP